ncbi:MAG: hypothetical protein BWY79_00934 [Actinobacteria bacterium ADurb.Bin444]|nr:MAG: hypothetical protein BWY79_00934 [Actinobacteria bacterium ADurb.Bin444]
MTVESITVGLQELLQTADVLPVAIEDAAVERLAHLEEFGEEFVTEVVGDARWYVVQHLGLHDVDAGVDGVGEDLAPSRFFQEALDAPVLVHYDYTELQWVVHALECNCDHGFALPMEIDHSGEIEVGQRVAGDDHESVVENGGSVLDRARSAERALFNGIFDAHAQGRPVPKVRPDHFGHEGDGHDHMFNSVSMEKIEYVFGRGLIAHGHHRFGNVGGKWTESRPLTSSHDDGFHSALPSRGTLT